MSYNDTALIPQAVGWMENNLNAMLIGLHGVGKTRAVLDAAEELGLKVKYYSCSTLDPYTDLVGVPFLDPADPKHTVMARPRDIDDAELIFFDEFNRADPKVHNAVLEIVQFGTINGEPLPHLRMVWAAMNPPGQEYSVEELDPALIDRFDVYEEVSSKPSAEYLSTRGMSLPVAKALVAWHSEQNQGKRDPAQMITPRRLEKIGQVWSTTGEMKFSIPLWFNCDRGKLRQMLQEAQAQTDAQELDVTGGDANSGPYKGFKYNDKWLRANVEEVAEYVQEHPEDLMTQNALVSVLKDRTATALGGDFGPLLSALTPSILESFVASLPDGKFTRLRECLAEQPSLVAPLTEALTEAVNIDRDRRQKGDK